MSMRIEKVARNVWKFTDWGGLCSNVYLVDVDKPTLIDLGEAEFSRVLVKGLKEIGYTPSDIKRVIFTHLHFDHVGNPHDFKNAEFFTSPEEIEDLEKGAFASILSKFGIMQDPLKDVPLQPVKSSKDFIVIETPGHTRGSICVWLRSKRILFSGDTLFHNGILGRTDLASSVPKKMPESIKRLQRFNYRILCPGH